MTTQQKPAPAVGQRWRLDPFDPEDGDEYTYTIVAPYDGMPAGFVHIEYADGTTGASTPESILTGSTYLGPLSGKAAVEAPTHWVIGSRWQQWDMADTVYRVVRISSDAKATLVWERGPGDEIEQCTSNLFEAGRWNFRGYASPPTGGVPVMGERWHENSSVLPTGCLECGAPVDKFTFCCPPCVKKGADCIALLAAWNAGARDFPRRPVKKDLAQAVPRRDSAAEPDTVYCDDGRGSEGVWYRPAPLREVGAGPNGPWLPYDSLVDSDPWDSYRHRRENGVVVAVAAAVGYEGHDFKGHVWRDGAHAALQAGRDKRSAANPVIAPPSPIDPTPGAGIPERRAYRTPSGEP